MSFYGLFIHNLNIIFSFTDPPSLRIFDLSKPDGKCIHTEEWASDPYGLCHSGVNERLDEVYVSFENSVVLYLIDIRDKVTFTRVRTICLKKKPMQEIACGLDTIFSANNKNVFVCSLDF